ncbi:MAG: hypothetical protein CENE_03282 [Candidatus Celerinatantimonas neptuna]|nr:MAG: hypothetical protein CENE_03282 [Candidatus Celerinatantimonas neptuna]
MKNSQRFPSFNGRVLLNYFDNASQVAEFFDIPDRTARDWFKNNRVPRSAKRLLDVAQAGFMPCSLGWEKFRIYNGLLYTPDGIAMTPEELRLITQAFTLPKYRNVQRWLNDRHDAWLPDWVLERKKNNVVVTLNRD